MFDERVPLDKFTLSMRHRQVDFLSKIQICIKGINWPKETNGKTCAQHVSSVKVGDPWSYPLVDFYFTFFSWTEVSQHFWGPNRFSTTRSFFQGILGSTLVLRSIYTHTHSVMVLPVYPTGSTKEGFLLLQPSLCTAELCKQHQQTLLASCSHFFLQQVLSNNSGLPSVRGHSFPFTQIWWRNHHGAYFLYILTKIRSVPQSVIPW